MRISKALDGDGKEIIPELEFITSSTRYGQPIFLDVFPQWLTWALAAVPNLLNAMSNLEVTWPGP